MDIKSQIIRTSVNRYIQKQVTMVEQDYRAIVESLREEIRQLKGRLREYETPPTEDRELQELARQLAGKGCLRYIPDGLQTGTPYVLPGALVEQKLTQYSQSRIIALAREGVIEGFELGSLVLTLRGTQELFAREQQSKARKLSSRGRRPGERYGL